MSLNYKCIATNLSKALDYEVTLTLDQEHITEKIRDSETWAYNSQSYKEALLQPSAYSFSQPFQKSSSTHI